MVAAADLVFPLLTGAAVVLVTLLADKLGGRAGGFLATAPVTTTAAHVVIAQSVDAGAAPLRVLAGSAALLAGTFALLGFFYAVKLSRSRPSVARLFIGLAVYVAVFLVLTSVFATFPLHPLSAFTILFATHAALGFSFMREPVPMMAEYAPKRARRPLAELAARFAAGAVVVALIRWLVVVYPPFAGALAVVPAVFIVSLTVMGLRQDARFAARAAQAGLFGTTAVAVFVLVVAGGLALRLPGGIWPILPLGWIAYGGTLAALSALHRRIAR